MNAITDFSSIERCLLPEACIFSEDARAVINCWESKEILACPGSGKTTVLIAKLKIIADQLPLKGSQGVCVLSHTNVAVNELKAKLGQSAERLLTYPNFVGTIQAFVNQYIAFPYLRRLTTAPIRVVSNEDYAIHLYNYICKTDSALRRFIEQQYRSCSAGQFGSVESFLADIYVDQGAIRRKGVKRALAGKDKPNASRYIRATKRLLDEEGVISYNDTYKYALLSAGYYGDSLRLLLSRRFKYVFIDEYQDCSEFQRNVLDTLFSNTETVYQKIGDVDQAIYASDKDEQSVWQIQDEYLSIANSNRYSQDIADVLSLLRTGKASIHSERGSRGIKPTLFIYDSSSISKVITAFVRELQQNGLAHSDGIYKAVGMFKNVSGLKISDYLPSFQKETTQQTKMYFQDFILEIALELSKENLYLAERSMRKLLCRILHYTNRRDESGKEYGIKSIKRYIAYNFAQDYQSAILGLSELNSFSFSVVEEKVTDILNALLGEKWSEALPGMFMHHSLQKLNVLGGNNNTFYDKDSGISITFDTVYGVKGETHDATLYLETEKSNGSDIKRIIPLLEGKCLKDASKLYEKSRRCVYVGFSRPKHLLCLAVRSTTYLGHEHAFSSWKIIHL